MQAVCGIAIVYLLRVFSHHLGFAKRGELGRVKERGQGRGRGWGWGAPFYLTPSPFVVFLLSPKASNVFLIPNTPVLQTRQNVALETQAYHSRGTLQAARDGSRLYSQANPDLVTT